MTSSILAFVGSYANASDPGLYACTFNSETGELKITDRISGLQNPTFLDIDAEHLKLYAIEEWSDEPGVRKGGAVAFAIDPAPGTLQLINRVEAVESPACHIALDRTKHTLFTSSYHGGRVGVCPIREDGSVAPQSQSIAHTGSSVHPNQTQARVHSVTIDRANRYAVVCDLGSDLIAVYRYEAENGQLVRNSEFHAAPGAGPRHFAFHPSMKFGYVISELNSTVTAFRYDAENGVLTELQTVPTLPEGYAGENSTADIHVSPDGRFLYGSNRGHDSIVVYAIDEAAGTLTLVEHVSTGGGHPRNFGLTPDGRFLLAANRDGNNIVTFVRDAESGRIKPNGIELEVSKPVCIKFLALK